MPKSINLGNGEVLVGLDAFGQVKDLYFHYAGLENHISHYFVHKIGVYVEDKFSWLDDGSWKVEVLSEKDSMASDVTATNDELGLEIHFTDIVYNENNIFIREVKVKNLYDISRKVRVFFNQQFNISETQKKDTAYYDPIDKVIIHYKGRRVFLINTQISNEGFSDYSVGLLGIEGKDGTYKDAEDGKLSKNAIEHGQVDSVIGVDIDIEPKNEKILYYWICIAKSIKRSKKLNSYVLEKRPQHLITTTKDYWRAWVKVQNFSFYGLGPPIIDLFNRSLIYIRTHVNKNGSIIASSDSDMLQFGRDTYAYVWPRDAAFCAIALEKAGDFNASRRFFEFCNDVITDGGFFMHKYRPDKALGSSWHPWIRGKDVQLPIQEDETALVIYALWQHYELSRDIEFIEGIYNTLIKKAADFMVSYRDLKTGLPKPSYDLWEQDYGISTFSTSCVYGALTVSVNFSKLLGKQELADKYLKAANEVREAILKNLFDEKEGYFYKQLKDIDGKLELDKTIDASSIYGIYKFRVLPPEDLRVKRCIEKTLDRIEVNTDIGGIARYEGDAYHHKGGNIPGNPWVITSMWIAQYFIEIAKSESDMQPVRRWISWAVKRANAAGILAEQYDPYSGEHVSASPLAWSHAEYVTTIINYLEKLEELGICKACYPIT